MKKSLFNDITNIVRDACFENEDSLAQSRRALLCCGYLITFAQAITTGAFFSAFMLLMGADDVTIGYVTMITTFCSFLQFFAPLFWERIPKRKPLVVLMIALQDFLTYGVITVLPLLPTSNSNKLALYFLLTLVTALLNNFCLPAQNAWGMQSVPLCKRVNFTSVSSLVSTVINVISVFLAGILLDRCQAMPLTDSLVSPTMKAILILRGLAFLAMTVSTSLRIFRVRELPYAKTGAEPLNDKRPDLSLMLLPLKNKAYMLSILVPCLWTLISNIIGNFFMLHLIENVRMSYTMISSANFITTPLILLLTPAWTLILDRRSWLKTLAWAFLGYSLAWVANVFISAETQYFYFIAIIIGQAFAPCITMVSNNIIYLHLPEENRTAYFGFYTLLTGISTFIGQTVGTLFVKYTPDLRFRLFGVPVCNLQMTSGIAAVCLVFLALYVFRLAKTSDISGRIVRIRKR